MDYAHDRAIRRTLSLQIGVWVLLSLILLSPASAAGTVARVARATLDRSERAETPGPDQLANARRSPAGTRAAWERFRSSHPAGTPGFEQLPPVLPGVDFARTVTVAPGAMSGWEISNFDDLTGRVVGDAVTSSGTAGEFALGSAARGAASFRQSVGTHGASAQRVRTGLYDGMQIADLDAVSYWTLVSSFGGAKQATNVQLLVDLDGDGAADDMLFFEPAYQDGSHGVPDQGALVLDTWQRWDAARGGWWSLNAVPGAALVTLEAYAAAHPGARLASTAPALRMVAGLGGSDWSGFVGSFDLVQVGGASFDFESATSILVTTPISPTPCDLAGWAAINVVSGGSVAITNTFPRTTTGSLEFHTTGTSSQAAFARGNTGMDLLSALSKLSIELYRENTSTSQVDRAPMVRLFVDNGGATDNYSYLVWEPRFNGVATFPTNAWTFYDLFAGKFWQVAFKSAGGSKNIDLYRTRTEWLGAGTVTDGNGDVSNVVGPNARVLSYEIVVGQGWTGAFDGAADRFAIAFGAANDIDFNFETSVGPTSVALTVTPSATTCGQTATFTATVSPSSATGTVEFFDGATSLGTSPIMTGGVATKAVTTLTAGAHTNLTATYLGQACIGSSTSPAVSHQVNGIGTSVSLVVTPATPTNCGVTVTFTATMNPTSAAGTVEFSDGMTLLGTASVNGSGIATLAVTTLSSGAHSSTLTAKYLGQGCNQPSTSNAASHQVNPVTTSVSLAPTPASPANCVPVSLTATVTPSSASGSVEFRDGATLLGTVTLSGGQASLPSTTFTASKHSLTAHYLGDGCHTLSNSTAISYVVSAATTSVSLVVTPSTTTCGQTATFTATVTPSSATGTVEFFDNATLLGTASIMAGVAMLPVTTLSSGAHPALTAHYLGNACYLQSTSSAASHSVNPATTSIVLTPTPSSPTNCGPVSLAGAVSPSTATGTVEFFDGMAPLGTALLNGSGVATLALPSLAAGSHSLTAKYLGNGCFAISSTPATSYLVNGVSTGTSLTVTPPGKTTCGDKVTLSATVTPAVPGSVQFLDGATVLGTVTLVGGNAALSVTNLAAGTRSLTAKYLGDGCNTPSTSSVSIHDVSPVPTSLTLQKSAPSPTLCGDKLTLMATLSPPGAGGLVKFFDGPSGPPAFLFTGVPSPPFYNDSPITVGTRFYSERPGYVTSIRFFKDALNTGAHSVELWTASGTMLANTPSVGESPSGWQTVILPAPVLIAANSEYIAAYHTTTGYSEALNFFTVPLHQAPLHAPAEVLPTRPNGAFRSGPAGQFPNTGSGAGNFYVDVGFVDATPLGQTNAVGGSAALSLPTLGVGPHSFFASYAGDGCNLPSVSNSLGHQLNLSPTSIALTAPAKTTCDDKLVLTGTVTPQSAGGTLTFFGGPSGPNAYLFASGPSGHSQFQDVGTYGVRFLADMPGWVSHIRFHKSPGNTGQHEVELWTGDGTLLSTATELANGNTGWAEIALPAPVPIAANTEYVAAYHTTTGFSYTDGGLNAAANVPPLHAPANQPGTPNGVFILGPNAGQFPTQSNGHNYWVDVVFQKGPVLGTSPLMGGKATLSLPNLLGTFAAATTAMPAGGAAPLRR